MWVDFARSTYQSTFTFAPGRPSSAEGVVWYFAPDRAQPLPFPTAFVSSNWDVTRDEGPYVIGEQRNGSRTYYRGTNVWGTTGQTPIGTAQQFLNGLDPGLFALGPFFRGSGGLGLGGAATLGRGSSFRGSGGLGLGGAATMGGVDVPITGQVVEWAGAGTPAGCVACDGTPYSTTVQAALYAVIGHTWDTFRGQAAPGAGLFRVPLLNGLVSVATGVAGTAPTTSARSLAQVFGEETHTLTSSESATALTAAPIAGVRLDSTPGGVGSVCGGSGDQGGNFADPWPVSGGGGGHNNLQPSVGLPRIIKT